MFPLDASSFGELFLNGQIAIYIGMSALNALLLFYASLKFLLVLQQCGYKGKRYFKWLSNRETPYLSRLMLLCLMGFLFFMVLNMCFSPLIGETWAQYIGFASYLLFTVLYIKSESSVNAKVPLKKTKRLVRLCMTYALVLTLVTFGFITLLNYLAFVIDASVIALLRYSLICGMPILTPYLLFIAYGLNEPYEEIRKRHHLRIAENKLKNTDVLKIGITGSYGKTTVKEILRTILSQKYRVLATPESYNTPLGIALTVKNLDSTHDVFIAEMGARCKGDIEALAKLVNPKYGVLTGVNNQHLETFKDIEVTKNTKYELFENLSEGGVGFFSSDNDCATELFARFDGEKYTAGLNGEDNLVTATDISTNERGLNFTLRIKGQEAIECSTVLLGRHSVKNICLAAAVAFKVGLSAEEIASGIGRIQSIGHRLELVPNNKNIVIIDDSYNSNEDGTKAAMEVLDTFKGRKIVLTPGLVELGKMEGVMNLEFGRLLAKHADIVIVIGNHNSETIINGLIEGGMARENIKFAKTLNKGNEILSEMLKEGDVVMFENDLPDNYN
ncbi:MAG: UDP-N-acetylmuramoyl-tripeptide--D-alanyl-D-alanine ligase [Clostridiales bacterium]|nr:UDP-N-acetylmuramoyl-tripeptide--D-alanyl-D-alanine ligase [Clostridiales bacterium]